MDSYSIRSRGREVARRKFLNGATVAAIDYEHRGGPTVQPLQVVRVDRGGMIPVTPGVFCWDVRQGRVAARLTIRNGQIEQIDKSFTRRELDAPAGLEGRKPARAVPSSAPNRAQGRAAFGPRP